jgi:hypothetical protein
MAILRDRAGKPFLRIEWNSGFSTQKISAKSWTFSKTRMFHNWWISECSETIPLKWRTSLFRSTSTAEEVLLVEVVGNRKEKESRENWLKGKWREEEEKGREREWRKFREDAKLAKRRKLL